MVRAVVTGASGRMGQALIHALGTSKELQLVGATKRPGSAWTPQEGARCLVSDNLAEILSAANAQVVIDFTSPAASLEHVRVCAQCKVACVVGTTGFSAAEKAVLTEAARQIPLVLSPNMSVGVNVMWRAAAFLAKSVGSAFDMEVVEAHHRRKKDAPSGTALRLAEEMARAVGRGPDAFRLCREGMVGERSADEIGIQSVRGGDVVGEHTAFFFGEGERLELTHRATSRNQFAQGALRAAKWVVQQPNGFYDMQDVLGLNP